MGKYNKMGKYQKKSRWPIWTGLVILAILGLVIVLSTRESAAAPTKGVEITVAKAPTCGCCTIYTGYLSDRGGMKVDVRTMSDVSPLKNEKGVPANLRSCHTSIVGGYFVEGHIPLEAIAKLLQEKPDIAGIAMPDMPSGSPGMTGAKAGPFVVYAVSKDGSVQEFMRI